MNDLLTLAHNDTTRLPLHQMVADLNKNLGTTLVAYIANVRSRQLPARWATAPGEPGHTEPRDEVKQRLQLAYLAFRAIEQDENEHVARQWLIGANPRLGGRTPAELIRDWAPVEIHGALDAFLDGTGGA